ncbi:STAS domain-containing protein [Streptomyces sp. CS7]|uniref:STAS domain-containing protein n=1 Tax=Streptomyces sp. CS-7 TaxID=2906769 RepID=UPI0021B2A454|nr:STAS domain-containing protein [Streptomyces sp. CS-7]MCT6781907.1 STAS domain-containing protein [Streptomyces sp. CS-7]
MATHPGSTPSAEPTMTVAVVNGSRAVLVLAGELRAENLRELEQLLAGPSLKEAAKWLVDMSDVTHLDLACAYALLRAATLRPEQAVLTIHGSRRSIQRTLRQSGLDTVSVFDER